jgi:hypothetical protein
VVLQSAFLAKVHAQAAEGLGLGRKMERHTGRQDVQATGRDRVSGDRGARLCANSRPGCAKWRG